MRTSFLFPGFALNFLRFCQKIDVFEFGQENGGALIETALALPLLALLLLGASELGLADYQAIEVANAAKAGAQYGAQNSTTAADIPGIRLAARNDASNLNRLRTTVSTTTISSGATIETILTVKTEAPFNPVVIIPGLTPSFLLHGQAVQMVIQ
jgi:Flp pilus assembly protein TadG